MIPTRRHTAPGTISILAVLAAVVSGSQSSRAGPPVAAAFLDIAEQAGVRFRFDNGSRGKHDLPEIMGGGIALIDFDGDGWLDVFLCDGGPIGDQPGRVDPPCRLFRNLRDGRFADVTELAGAPGPSYAMGAAVGDIDGDGRDDLFVSGWGDQRLYRNLGGRFEDITDRAGVRSDRWSTSAAFADLDRDGDLDLYVATYAHYDARNAPYCAAPDGRRDFCGPEVLDAQADILYRNNGDGTFTDVSRTAGIDLAGGRGLGVLVADLAGDALPDLYVANDGTACWLFENRGALRFEEVGLAAGAAVDGQGAALAGMGVALGDIDGDGSSDLAVGNFLGRGTIGFRAIGGGRFQDRSAGFGLTAATIGVTGFGLALEDFDADGRLDLFQANGHVLDRLRLGVPVTMPPTLLRNRNGRLVAWPETGPAPPYLKPVLGRGLAVGDLDRDGRPDVVLVALDAPARILRNQHAAGNWLALDLVGKAPSPRAAIGARVRMKAGDRSVVREVVGGGSYLSASSRTVHLGLGDATAADRIEVTWPSGRVESWNAIPVNRRVTLEEGTAARRP